MNISKKIIESLPYSRPFLFVDEIAYIDQTSITGSYTFKKEDKSLYSGHFKKLSVIPGVLIIEAALQLAGVAHGVFLLNLYDKTYAPYLSYIKSDIYEGVIEGEKIITDAKIIYLRGNYLKSSGVVKKDNGNVVMKIEGICKFMLNE